jgi:hypothetical protein
VRIAGICIIALAIPPLAGWGPHAEIVDAAIAVLPARDQARLLLTLGDEARRLRFLVWMGDFGNQFVQWNESWNRSGTTVEFYANDYLIFPQAPRFYKHECPDVNHTFTPFLLRSLQALQTETPANAARWIGSLLHFTTDTGSPPHAANISGDTHSKMENWISGAAISIPEYKPRLMGRTPAEATHGFEERMAGLIEFSKQRAGRLHPFIRASDRAGAEPIVLESANETARVTADLLHTLLFFAEPAEEQEAVGALEASVNQSTTAGIESLSAKLMFAGTSYSTMSELVTVNKGIYRGVFLLRNARPGTYRAIVSRVGAQPLFVNALTIRAGTTTRADWRLETAMPAGNLAPNPDFRSRWTAAAPDQWRVDEKLGAWVSDNIRVESGKRYRFEVDRLGNSAVLVQLFWYKNHWQPSGDPIAVESAKDFVAPQDAQYARVSITTPDDPARSVKTVSLTRF